MQALFPEGGLFTIVLTGLATTAPYEPDADGPQGREPFPPDADPPNGVFHSGWTLLLAVEVARLSGTRADRVAVLERAAAVRDALGRSETGLLEAYPGESWPCDTVVAVAALQRADDLVGVPGVASTTARWLRQMDRLRDPATGLLPHHTTPEGQTLAGPRGSSQALIQAFWPDVQPPGTGRTDADWSRFRDAFVERRLGMIGVREYPRGQDGPGDIDSGPLLLGLSASASVVTLAAARAHGDVGLAHDLDRGVELVAAGWTWDGRRRYAAGRLPVGDAFLAWARSAPEGPSSARAPSAAPRARWVVPLAILAVPGGLAGALLSAGPLARRRYARRSTSL